jgi:hypothetical protein
MVSRGAEGVAAHFLYDSRLRTTSELDGADAYTAFAAAAYGE